MIFWMRLQNIGQFKTADEYVADKVKRFAESDHSFTALFSFMFSERENILYEQSNGYSIRKVTYGEAYTQTLRLAKSLQGVLREVPAQSIVAIAMQNSVEWIETFWAVLLCGYRPLLVNLRLDSSSLNEVLQSAKVQVVISDSLHYPIQTILFSEIPASEEVLTPAVCGEEFFVMSSGTSFHVKLCAYSSEELYYQICDSAKIIKQSKKSKEHYQGE
jgi:long-subunit acyl-CoA synthetase (AMP-forming)